MNVFPFNYTWQETILFYRFLRHRKGFGVHSPFAFSFITKVIDERCGYYCYQDIELIRRQLEHKGNKLARKDIKRSHGELLFRTVNFFKPKKLLQIGSPAGIASLYLTAYASDVKAIVLEKDTASAETTNWSLQKYHSKVQLCPGDYEQTLPAALQDLGKVDFAFFQASQEKEKNRFYLEETMKHIHPDTVFFLEGIRVNQEMRALWKEICNRKDVILTFDLYQIGIVIFQPRFYKKNYVVYF
ncbi:MAG: SAM-dependent methyltransferase [Parabacteroides sp.]|nr:SAM-dependent methyltransferase [Parabacteroides sp.]